MYRLAIALLSLTVLLLTSGYGDAHDLFFQCTGTVDSFKASVWTRDNQQIAVWLNDDRISFSGNRFLSGENIKLCAKGDDIYFDSAGCNEIQGSETRRSGVFDSVLMTLDLTNAAENLGVNGYFTCRKVDAIPGHDL
jgi:hypothetical protein